MIRDGLLSISEKKWPHWNEGKQVEPFKIPSLSISEKKWPHWNPIFAKKFHANRVILSISEKKWPHWNRRDGDGYRIPGNSIHFWKEVAPLKQSGTDYEQRALRSIHFWKEVAPLKHYIPGKRGSTKRRSIHFWKEVAPLKRPFQPSASKSHSFYPFLKRSGPIETPCDRFAGGVLDPLSISEKKWPHWNKTSRSGSYKSKSLYPFLKRSGPIETLSSPRREAHACMAAASGSW